MNFNVKEFQNLLTKYTGMLVLVEGKKDAAALQILGFSNVLALNGKPLFEVVEFVVSQSKDCLILTDLDAEGKKLYSRLSHELMKQGVQVHNQLRNWLFKNTDLRQIEGLTNFLANLSYYSGGHKFLDKHMSFTITN